MGSPFEWPCQCQQQQKQQRQRSVQSVQVQRDDRLVEEVAVVVVGKCPSGNSMLLLLLSPSLIWSHDQTQLTAEQISASSSRLRTNRTTAKATASLFLSCSRRWDWSELLGAKLLLLLLCLLEPSGRTRKRKRKKLDQRRGRGQRCSVMELSLSLRRRRQCSPISCSWAS